MNYNQALSYALEDKDWLKKITLGGLFNFLALYTGILFFFGFFSVGYTVEIIRRILRDQKEPMPEWNDMGKKFIDGLLVVIICFVYLVVIGGPGAIYIVYVSTARGFYGGFEAFLIVVGSVSIAVLLSLFVSTAIIRYAATDDFSAAFHLDKIFSLIGYNFGNLIAIIVFVAVLQVLLFVAGLGILSPFTVFWGMIVEAHLLAQYGKGFEVVV